MGQKGKNHSQFVCIVFGEKIGCFAKIEAKLPIGENEQKTRGAHVNRENRANEAENYEWRVHADKKQKNEK